MEWETVIGLEVHTQLKTSSKIFSGASTAFGAEPNTQACAIDLGLPGVLPVLNKEAVLMAVRLGLAIGAKIAPRSVFARKNYFYPDLPKGYQISQYELPIVHDGSLTITDRDGTELRIGITRAHLEEDAGKSLHEAVPGMSGIDLNRAGTPLLEIVSEPDMRTSFQAAAYMRKLHGLVRYLGICDGNMQEGSLRCDANVSVRPKGQTTFGTRTEIKNLNSFRFVERAIDYEVERQIEILENGGSVKQETRLYDSERDETRPMRSKEEANDYRYFPDPDLLPVELDETYIQSVRASLPELPEARRLRFRSEYGLSDYDAETLSGERLLGDYFEQTAKLSGCKPKLAANWIIGDLLSALNNAELEIDKTPVSPARLAGLLKRIEDQTLSIKLAKDVFQGLWTSEDEADAIIEAHGLKQITDESAIEAIVDEVIARNAEQAEQFRQGKDKVLSFLVGQAMRASRGKANPGQLNALFRKKLAAD